MATAYTCKLLHCFHKIAKHNSFSKAAVELGVAQPNLSLMMTRLEDIVGEKLFDQRRPPMRISSVGHRIIHETRRLCDEMEQAHLLVTSIRSTRRSTVRIGGSSATADIILRKIIIKTFTDMLPEIDVVHIDVPTRMELAYLADQKVDLLFSYCPPVGFPNAVIDVSGLCFVVPSEFDVAKRDVVTKDDLTGLPIVVGTSRLQTPPLPGFDWTDTVDANFVSTPDFLTRENLAYARRHRMLLPIHDVFAHLASDCDDMRIVPFRGDHAEVSLCLVANSDGLKGADKLFWDHAQQMATQFASGEGSRSSKLHQLEQAAG